MDQAIHCDFCQKPSIVEIKRDLAGVAQTVRLCADCAESRGIRSFDSVLPNSLADLYEVLFDPSCDDLDDKTCPECGTAFRRIRASGSVGCVTCFDTFRPQIARLLPRIARQTSHAGSLPQSLHAYRRIFADMDDLKSRLAAALEAERYEDAAHLRDTLQSLEAGPS